MADVGSTACQICVIIDLLSLSLPKYQSPYIGTDYQYSCAKEIKRCFQLSDMLRGSTAVELTRIMCWLGARAGSAHPSASLHTQFATWYKQFCSDLTSSLKQIEKKDFILPSFLMWLAESQNIISSIFHSLWHLTRSFMLLKLLKNKLRREQ